MRQKSQAELGRAAADEALRAARMPVVFVLENVRSGNNVGAVLRSADAFGVAEVVMTGITPTPPHREILKASLGAEASVEWRYEPSAMMCLDAFRQNGSAVYALEQTTESVSLATLGFGESESETEVPTEQSPPTNGPTRRQPIVIVLGNEVRGVSPEVLSVVDGAVEIPQHGTKHSLNVSVAAGIVAYALRLQWDALQNT